MKSYSAQYSYTDEELDIIEMSVIIIDLMLVFINLKVYGDLRRSIPGPLPTIASSVISCRCKSELEINPVDGEWYQRKSKKYEKIQTCSPPDYSRKTHLPTN